MAIDHKPFFFDCCREGAFEHSNGMKLIGLSHRQGSQASTTTRGFGVELERSSPLGKERSVVESSVPSSSGDWAPFPFPGELGTSTSATRRVTPIPAERSIVVPGTGRLLSWKAISNSSTERAFNLHVGRGYRFPQTRGDSTTELRCRSLSLIFNLSQIQKVVSRDWGRQPAKRDPPAQILKSSPIFQMSRNLDSRLIFGEGSADG